MRSGNFGVVAQATGLWRRRLAQRSGGDYRRFLRDDTTEDAAYDGLRESLSYTLEVERAKHEPDECEPFIVAREAAEACKPAEAAFDDPAARQHPVG